VLSDLHTALKQLVLDRGQVANSGVDVHFASPTREWVNSLTRPAINFFLFDVQENTDLRRSSFQTQRGETRAVHRMPPRRFDLRYMVSALATLVEDEHLLIWRMLVTLLKYPELPRDVMPPGLVSYEPTLSGRMLKAEESPRSWDLWAAFDGPPRPSLLYALTVPVELGLFSDVPLVLTRTVRYTRGTADAVITPEIQFQIGGTVRDRQSRPVPGVAVEVEGSADDPSVTDGLGRFTLHNLRSGAVALRVTSGDAQPSRVVTFDVPSDRYDIVLD
jgi:Pvc16 N-terminal domain/Carboxypeptidase regulatory-like domain